MQIFRSLHDPKLIKSVQNGAVGVLPTDTVYGLVCSAKDEKAVERLYSLKSREHKPGTVIAATVEQLAQLGLKARYLKAVEHFWPGAISVIIPSGPELSYLHQELFGLATRIPADDAICDLLLQTGPLLTSSANLPEEAPANTVEEAKAYFGTKVDFYVDGGDLSHHEASTVIAIRDDAIEVLRQGAVKIDEYGRITK